MREAGVVSRSRMLYRNVAERLRSHGVEVVPFLTVGCLVVGFWCTLSLASIVQAMGLRSAPAPESASAAGSSFRPPVQLRVIASIGRVAVPVPQQMRGGARVPTRVSRERGATPVPTALPIRAR